jgi:SAM-dependent methyltransferase
VKTIDVECPGCANRGMQQFYAVDNVPVNSCLVVDSADAGRAYPRGDLRVAVCEACGFITNTAFDLRRLTYDATYEETQTFSPTFTRFQDRLIRRLLDEHDLYGKTVVEIGCGKGDFLARLAELGDVRGIGIDPTSVQGRLQGKAAENVRFINEFYGPQHASIPADLIACRHALEHIPDVDDLLRTVRDAVAERPIPIFFELPETMRVLREGAYWDIYFEHCNYFTPGSLARSFERRGFSVTGVWLGYDEQYLMLEARPRPRTGSRRMASYAAKLDQPGEVVRAAADFEASIDEKLNGWRQYFSDAARQGKKVAIWGSGSKCVAFLSTIRVDREIAFVTDVNPHRHGKYLVGTGKAIVPPSALAADPPDEVIVMNPIYRDEVAAMLDGMNVGCRVITAETPLEAVA